MSKDIQSSEDDEREIEDLRARLEEAQEVLAAIRSGRVDALAIEGPDGEKIYTLEGADHPYRIFVETMNEGAMTISTDGTILYCNQVLADMIGLPLEHTLGSNVRRFICPADLPLCDELIHAQCRRAELFLLHTSGTAIPVQMSARGMSPLSNVCVVVTDLRSQKLHEKLHESEERLRSLAGHLEQVVNERTQELLQSQRRLRALAAELNLAEQRERKRLAGELHDYLAQLLVLCCLKLGQVRRDGLPSKAEVRIQETEEVLSQALNYTRTVMAELSPTVLHEHGLATGLKWLGEQMQRHGLLVKVDVTDADWSLSDDITVLLYQSVRELLMNALKHAQSNSVTVRLDQSEGTLRIEVHDEGVGFDPTVAGAVDHATPMSSKFGLFSIRERMTALGGWFDLHSAPRQGTTATLVLPFKTADSSELKVLSAELSDQVRNSEPRTQNSKPHQQDERIRVLLVDDHTLVRQGLRSVLDSYADIEVVGEAWNGEVAVAAVDTLHPAVVLMDISMPKMNGIEATALIKARHPEIVVVGLSVHAGGVNERAMIHAGAAMLLTKEAAVDEVYRAIRPMLDDAQCATQSLGDPPCRT